MVYNKLVKSTSVSENQENNNINVLSFVELSFTSTVTKMSFILI